MQISEYSVTQNTFLPGETIVASFRTARNLRRVLARTDISVEHDLNRADDELVVSASIFDHLSNFLKGIEPEGSADVYE